MAATATRAGTKLLTPAGLPPRAARTTTTTTTTVLPLTSPAGQRSYRYDRASSLSLSSARASVSWLACRQASSSSSPAQHQLLRGQRRGLHGTALLRSGHNRWSSIKHDKAKNDKNKSKERSMISRDIIAASRQGGPDAKTNTHLALAIGAAKRSGMQKATIEAAVLRGQGVNPSGAPLEAVTIEAMLPGSVAAVIECLTDQKPRTLQDVRFAIKTAGGVVSPTSYLFEKKGKVMFGPVDGGDGGGNGQDSGEEYLEHAIDAGALDMEVDEQGRLLLYTEHTATKAVGDAFAAKTGLKIQSSDIVWEPNKETMVSVEDKQLWEELEDLLTDLREDPSVQEIYLNATPS